jgi:photosystem II stability/assembly factor-like uncharacterized protein
MNKTDDPLDLVNGLKPVMLDRLADDAYARRHRGDLARVAAEGQEQSSHGHGRRRRPGIGRGSLIRRPLPAMAAAAAAVALLVLAAQSGPWHPGAQAHGSRPTAEPGLTKPSSGRTESPPASSRMRLVASVSSPFRSSGAGPQTDSLDCVTASVCYVWDAGSEAQAAYRTSDGGATWRSLAALPGNHTLAGQNAGPPSCPTAEMCAGIAGGMTLAVTTDGGAHWRLESLPVPPGKDASIGEVSCATALRCVVQAGGTFLSTVNGGRTWAEAARVPKRAPGLWCDPDGRCIGLAPTGTNANGGIVSMTSADNGRTWVVTGSHHAPASDLFMVSCGDALHCMFLSNYGPTMTTSDGGVTWQDTTAVSTSREASPLTVNCATALDCFVAVSDFSATAPGATAPGGYEDATIVATHDGGATWTAIALPEVDGTRLAEVYPASCPSTAGCIAVAATPRQANGVDGQREIISSFPAASSPVTGG